MSNIWVQEENTGVLGEKEAVTRRNISQNGYRKKKQGNERKRSRDKKKYFAKWVQEEKASAMGEKEAVTRRNISQNGYRKKSKCTGRKRSRDKKKYFTKWVQEEKASAMGEKEAATRRNISQNGYRKKKQVQWEKKKPRQEEIFHKKGIDKKQAEVFMTSQCAANLRRKLPLKLCGFYANKFLIIFASKTTSVT